MRFRGHDEQRLGTQTYGLIMDKPLVSVFSLQALLPPCLNRSQKMRLVTFGSAQPLSSEVVVDLHKNRFPLIGKHEVKSGHIYAGPVPEAEHHC